MIDKGIMVLQLCTDFPKDEPCSGSDMCPTSCHDVDHIMDIKVEDDPVPVTLPGVKPDTEASFMPVSPVLGTFHRYLKL
jgi:hypothetical protein